MASGMIAAPLSSRPPRSGEPGSLADSPPGLGDRRKRRTRGRVKTLTSIGASAPMWFAHLAVGPGGSTERFCGRPFALHGIKRVGGLTVPKAADGAFA